jgi:hypothetical protein
MSAGHRFNPTLPPLIRQVARAAETHRPSGHAEALRQFARLALVEVPARGALAPSSPDLLSTIEIIAGRHLGLGAARQRFFDATDGIAVFELRDRVESAHSALGTISDVTYFYVGFAFGVTLASITTQ